MKKFTKLLGIVLIIALVLSLGASAFADDTATTTPITYTITINKNSTDKAAHTYGAFQIFKGDLDEKTEGTTTIKTLSNIQWGDDITPSATLITAINTALGLTGDNALAATATAAAVAKAISDKSLSTDSATAQALADAFNAALESTPSQTGTIAANATSGTITGLNAGYYLIKDTKAVTGEGALTRFMLEVVSNVSVKEKASVPSITKKVKEKNDSAAESQTNPTGWQDAADYDIGDSVPFQITAKTASTVSDYTKYHVTIQDKQSDGLTAPEGYTISVLDNTFYMKADGSFYSDAEMKTAITSNGGVATTTDGTKITVSKETPASGNTFAIKVTFENSASTTDAPQKIKNEANSQDIVVTYSSVLNDNAKLGAVGNPNEVYLNYSNNPNSTDDNDEGKTPNDKVIVFTYEIKALKVEPDGKTEITAADYADLTEAAKANYEEKTNDDGTKVYVAKTKELSGAGFTLYKLNAASTATDKYEKVGDEITGVTTFEFKGTDAGQYKLVETTVPAGYNKAEDIIFTVNASYDTEEDDPKLSSLSVTVTSPTGASFTTETVTYGSGDTATTSANAVVSTTVLNQSGTVLPSTGGIGTTIFYVVGSILVIAAGVLLITKKRMGRD